jgi:FMN phosphatase YigB (HAD superfamily)
VGDTVEADVAGARAAGLTPVLIDRERRSTEPGEGEAEALRGVPVIASLAELLPLVASR